MENDFSDYFDPPVDSFWKWSDDSEALLWSDDNTIAFREEVLHVMQCLSSIGLPSLGSIALLLAATKESWREKTIEGGIIADILESAGKTQVENLLPRVLGGLDRINLLPDEHRNTYTGKSELAELIFEESIGLLDKEFSKRVLDHFQNEGIQSHNLNTTRSSSDQLLKDLGFFIPGIDKVKESTLKLRSKTGLEELPKKIEVELPESNRVRGLLKELENDHELSGLSTVSQQLMAAASLPRSIEDRDDLPLGGVSDISNRGSLDRLLLSELANDDLTLAVRVAMNEALYFQRETPPSSPSLQRLVLLDSGIRSWGVSRLFSLAVALAFSATNHNSTDTKNYSSKGSTLLNIDLMSQEGLINHLGSLFTDIHPGPSLVEFQKRIDFYKEEAEAILITTDAVFADSDFTVALDKTINANLFLVTVNDQGRFILWHKSFRGIKKIRELYINLAQLFQKKESVNLIDRDEAEGLPAIFSLKQFPLLLSHAVVPETICHIDNSHSFSLARDGRLTLWSRRDRGAKELYSQLRYAKKFVWHYLDKLEDRFYAVTNNNGLLYDLLQIDFTDYEVKIIPIGTERQFKTVCSHNGMLFFIAKGKAEIKNMQTGAKVGEIDLPSQARFQFDRFFNVPGANQPWKALSFDGTTATLETLSVDRKGYEHLFIKEIFEGDTGTEIGPFGITNTGNLYSFNTEKVWNTSLNPIQENILLAVSNDKKRIAVSNKKRHSYSGFDIFDLKSRKVYPSVGNPKAQLELQTGPNYELNLRKHFESIYIDELGFITLVSRKGYRLRIDYSNNSSRIIFNRIDSDKSEIKQENCTFKKLKSKKSFEYNLSVASWREGSQAFLDSRGLLHIKSSDVTIPEVSIVLHEHYLSGWTSDGKFFGHKYFIDDNHETASEEIYTDVIQRIAFQIG